MRVGNDTTSNIFIQLTAGSNKQMTCYKVKSVGQPSCMTDNVSGKNEKFFEILYLRTDEQRLIYFLETIF